MYKRMNEQLQKEGAMALVTGASSGIGLAYARELARRGYDLLLVSNEQERIGTVAEELATAFGVKTIPLCMDLARSEAARELYDYCEREKLQIGILVNNAGIFFFDDLTEVAPERIETMLLLHIRTVTLNMSSLSAWTPAPGISVYAASKSYIRKFSQMLRYELHQYGVGVTTVCPGAIATGLYNLSDYYQRLALRLGVMMKPERLARKGLRAMFARRDYILPGAVNRFFVLALYLLPVQLIYYIKEHTKLYRYGR